MKIKIFLILNCVFLLISCGKSPLLKELPKETSNVQALEAQNVFKTTSQKIQITWISPITSIDEGKAIIILTKDGVVFEDSHFTLGAYLWMKNMGHGSSPVVITKLATGVYQLSEIYFSMTGMWQLHLTLNKNKSIIENIEFNYNLSL
jgi:hypothetical protein